ncbi:ABC-type transport auxiliary lipoprotein family protein [Halopseudomonas sp.]|uniref:ABC-type transport auxiliary lipoprotein family protein n=1 Tax=Halopseudomonas sp. TaxID=2901191 RepID=UPI003567C8C7
MRQPRRSILGIFALTSLFWLSACTVFPQGESQRIYQLPAPNLPPSTMEPLAQSLRIDTPQAGSVLSSPRMVVNPRGNELQTYKGARWSDPVPALLREHLARAFGQSKILKAVSSDESSFRADIHLSSNLRRFQVIYEGSQPSAVIELHARLIDPVSREIIAGETFVVEQRLKSAEVPGVVEGFKLASDELASQLIDWTRSQVVDIVAR